MAADEPIPVFTIVQDAHPIPTIAAREAVRYAQLADHYTSLFGHPPTHIARAPGRVNIIGEHIDYALFGVFPMAVEQDVLIACGPNTQPGDQTKYGEVKARNTLPKYEPREFVPTLIADTQVTSTENHTINISEDPALSKNVQWHMDIDKTQLRWESYVKAGYYGVLKKFFNPNLRSSQDPQIMPKPVDILVTGSVPAGSGLSSSAAMVVASTLAFLAVNDKLTVPDRSGHNRTLTKGELVEMAVENEKRVGVNSGGMDQAASVTSLPTSALYISFFPFFSVENVALPITQITPRAVFVCANSLVVSDKVVGAKTRYNLRVVETLVAARVLARSLLSSSSSPSSQALQALLTNPHNRKFTLREVLSAYLGINEIKGHKEPALSVESVKKGLEELVREVGRLKARVLRGEKEFVSPSPHEEENDEDEGVMLEEMVKSSGFEEDEFREVYLSWVDVEATHFHLYKRTKHVLTESLRVLQFRETCLAFSSSLSSSSPSHPNPEHLLTTLGNLMTTSHTSCSHLYTCSHPSLDTLTSLALRSGAYGSRLTGAGWGGCTISLVREDEVGRFVRGLREGYEPYKGMGDEEFEGAVFVSRPGSGAFVFKIED
ncbi:Galactokinase [Irpex rosettiformis]|uniref:Galactokinase n=1 Tax=Irpex rosettiformis TaxID=378272 RepID=A0ACB8U9K8_9APHY|nr:Galactokinase [Irpex rosettiformis]